MDVKAIRQKAGLTQRQFAKKLSVSYATVQAWEQGRIDLTPEKKRLINLTEFVGWHNVE